MQTINVTNLKAINYYISNTQSSVIVNTMYSKAICFIHLNEIANIYLYRPNKRHEIVTKHHRYFTTLLAE